MAVLAVVSLNLYSDRVLIDVRVETLVDGHAHAPQHLRAPFRGGAENHGEGGEGGGGVTHQAAGEEDSVKRETREGERRDRPL